MVGRATRRAWFRWNNILVLRKGGTQKSPGLEDRVLSNMRVGAPILNFFQAIIVYVAGVLAKTRGGRVQSSYGSGGPRRTVSVTWLEASLCNVLSHVFWPHGRTLGVCEVQLCEGRVFFLCKWLETGGLCFRRAGNADACCI